MIFNVFDMAFISQMNIGKIRNNHQLPGRLIKFNAVKAAAPSNPDTMRSEWYIFALANPSLTAMVIFPQRSIVFHVSHVV
jgi:hypothetical protein